ncbi:MAG: CotH kinase family protein [Rhodococcus sp. (in: high G+C Gram-positive bacteria)]|uniref:CotH kinase family protein n=1 Tax=Rhodococcus sp. EPR-157 TaxID=1813677 RepID=UPI000A514E7B
MAGPNTNLPPVPTTFRRRLVHRLPRTLRQHWKIAAALMAFVVVMATVFGSTKVRPYITGDATVIASEVTENVQGTVDLFDPTVSHTITVDIADGDFQTLKDSFQNEGVKESVPADITIDGTLITDVGVRLKGNSTLATLSTDDGTMPGGRGAVVATGTGVAAETGLPAEAGAEAGAAGAGQAGGMGMFGEPLSFDEPEDLPFLIDFAEFSDGRAYQGHTTLSLRPYTPALNEAVSLAITAESGQATQDFTYTTYSVNGSVETTRLLVVAPDDAYANSIEDGDGVLYKASADSKFSYQGDDQTTYAEQYTQINALGTADLQPIITLLKWLDSADQAEFDAHLADYVDVDSLASYSALQNLLGNGDDMGGPGKNFYLYYDLDTKKFSFISWDLNLALATDSTAGAHEEVSMGPGGGAGGGGMGEMPEGFTPPEGMEMPEGMPGGGAMFGNSLKDRFLESAAFTDEYDAAYRTIYSDLWASGKVLDVVDEVAASVPISESLTQEEIDADAAELKSRLQLRIDSLVDDAVVTGTS